MIEEKLRKIHGKYVKGAGTTDIRYWTYKWNEEHHPISKMSLDRFANKNYPNKYAKKAAEVFINSALEVDAAIKNTPAAECLTSPYPYIRECKKWFLKMEIEEKINQIIQNAIRAIRPYVPPIEKWSSDYSSPFVPMEEINKIIEEAEPTVCLTSQSEYIREYRRKFDSENKAP